MGLRPPYRLYIDEVGTSSTRSCVGQNRYLSLTAVILAVDAADELGTKLAAFKQTHFPQPDGSLVELHRKKMAAKLPPFRSLRNPRKAARVREDLFAILACTTYQAICVGIDKHEHTRAHGGRAWDPYDYALMCLMERYALHLQVKNTRGDVVVEARGAREDERLRRAFARVYSNGGKVGAETMLQRLTSRQLKVKTKKEQEPGLELVDQLASPADKLLKGYHGAPVESANDWDRRVARLLLTYKLRRSEDDVLDGYGMKWIVPSPHVETATPPG